MPERSPATFEARASLALGAASVGAQVVTVIGVWILVAFAGEDVAGFCRTPLASPSTVVFMLLQLLWVVGTFVVPLLVLVGLVRGGARRSLLPGVGLAIVLVLYFAGVRAEVLPRPPRHPCLRSDASEPGSGDGARVAARAAGSPESRRV